MKNRGDEFSNASEPPMDWVGDWSGRRRTLTPDRTAVIEPHTQTTLTYRALDDRACALAARLADDYGLGPGDRLALVARNRLEALVLFLACGKIGAVLAPVSHRLAPAEIEALLQRLAPAVVATDSPVMEGLGDVLPPTTPVYDLDIPLTQPADGAASVNRPLSPGALAMLIHTGGSTGLPKICRVSHRQMIWNAIELLVSAPESMARRRELLLFPLFHIGGWNTAIPVLYAGGTVILQPAFEAETVLANIDRYDVNHLGAVEAMLQALRAAPNFERASLRSLEGITVAGGPCSQKTMEAFLDRGVAVNQAYGLTEAGPSNLVDAADDVGLDEQRARAGSVGTSFYHCDYRIIDPDTGQRVGTGEVGELQLRSPHSFDGYWDDPSASAARWAEAGWLRSGDLAREAADGRVRIVGRLDNVIISGGEKVAAEEIEAALAAHPAVNAALVFAMSDPRWGQRPVAVFTSDAPITMDALRDWLRPRLASYKQPADVMQVTSLPLTGSGKPDRQQARADYQNALRGRS
ncbi:AMP-binding protein [Spiribacter sp. 218]|uniref:class I adenylate-forming enzyme family protein n=1 Tax=Spiribacter pallidus TaxID=1987936 RepID=UPI00349F0A1E